MDDQAQELLPRVYPVVKLPCGREGYVVWMEPGRRGACVTIFPDLETEWVPSSHLTHTGNTVTVTVFEDH